jgi:hypothetical protein
MQNFSKALNERAKRDDQLINTEMGLKKGDNLTEAKGWKELVSGLPEDKAVLVANMCENYKTFVNEMREIDETSASVQVGNFEKFGFPIISMTAENMVTPELVSTQSLQGPSSNIFYMDFVTSKARGNVAKGTSVWDARQGHHILGSHGGDNVPNEQLFTEATGTTTYTGNLGRGPIRPGTVEITRGGDKLVDDGNGNITGTGLASGAINYLTGEYSLTVSAEVNNQIVDASYAINLEGQERMGLDFQITSTQLHAQELSLSGKWTIEAAQALKALHGQNAEASLTGAISNELTFEIDRIILADLSRIAGAGEVTWDATAPANISYTEHKLTILDAISEISLKIQKATNRVRPNWIVGGLQFCAIVENLPMFVAENANKAETDGVMKLGKLNRYSVYCDPHMAEDEALVGYKGDDWMRTGYVYAPWLLLYTTPTTILDDMVARKGFMTSFGNKVVNNKYFGKIKISNFSASF